jgi:hypothetical protein
VRIVFDPATIEQGTGPSRSITGVLYLDFGAACFPVERWNDFAVVITSAWLEAVQRLEKGIDHEVLVHFMEGPYQVAATRLSGDQIRFRCIERRLRGEHVQHEELVKLGELGEQVRRVARQVASACVRAGMQSTDLDKLKSQLPN